jgi:glycosyltransferase involved in cell wall biosynthesis
VTEIIVPPPCNDACFFLDATPLLDENWTGIPAVCANLARTLLAAGCDLRFCVEWDVLPPEAVLDALERNTGLFLDREFRMEQIECLPLVWPSNRVSVGISASVKRLRNVFNVECSILHDISTLLHPHYHTEDNIAWHVERILSDLSSNDVTICISRSTQDDLIEYLGSDPERLLLSYNGVEWPQSFEVCADSDLANGIEDYIVVLATIEPRKNLSLIFNMLCSNPDLLVAYRWVFIGKAGWLLDQTSIPAALTKAVADGRIIQTGFVTEYEKYTLLRGAILSIFPSFFEGFGLPVVESLSVRTPCVASHSSSITEVGGDLCYYFDPCSIVSLYDAIKLALVDRLKGTAKFNAECANWVKQFSWNRNVEAMLNSLVPAISAAAKRT